MSESLSPDSRELLLEDLKTWNESFWKNEGAGESRINFYITLLTAIGGGLGALYQFETKDGAHPELTDALVPVALTGLLLFGLVTFMRMVRRNTVTDEYKEWGDQIRRHLLGDSLFERIYGLSPKKPTLRGLWNGGLASMMLFMNAMVAGVLAGCIVYAGSGIQNAWLAGVAGFAVMVAFQRWFMSARHHKACSDYAIRSRVRDAARTKGATE